MILKEIIKILNAEVIVEGMGLDVDIKTVCASYLMSDVLAFSKAESLLITGLTNPQTVRTAEMTEIVVICYVHGKQPGEVTIELAKKIIYL